MDLSYLLDWYVVDIWFKWQTLFYYRFPNPAIVSFTKQRIYYPSQGDICLHRKYNLLYLFHADPEAAPVSYTFEQAGIVRPVRPDGDCITGTDLR